MSLNIKNPETHELVRELAERTGESMTQAITVAVRERLKRLGVPAGDAHARYAAIMKIAEECAPRMTTGIGSQDIDAFLYDPETGLARGD